MRKYRTVQGDTWDMIAYRAYSGYGGERNMPALIMANSEYADYVKFPAGIILDVPEIDLPVSKSLPPWRR